jgi:hypothetical protein
MLTMVHEGTKANLTDSDAADHGRNACLGNNMTAGDGWQQHSSAAPALAAQPERTAHNPANHSCCSPARMIWVRAVAILAHRKPPRVKVASKVAPAYFTV